MIVPLRLLLVAAAALSLPAAVCAEIRLVPQPVSVSPAKGQFRIRPGTAIVVPAGDEGASRAAAFLNLLFAKSALPELRVVPTPRRGAIRFSRGENGVKEGYRLDVGPGGVAIEAADDSGLFYGAVTLWQLATGERAGIVPAVEIRDAPRFGWRGLMLDSARHFQSPAYVRALLDWMAVNKLNTLHWHLVDDQGWRIEIEKYPKLTDISAWRHPATAPGAPQLPRIGGFYTQDEIRDIVAYAAARRITIVPEIEMPGHALAAIRAYPELGTGTPIPPGVESDWGIFPWLYNVEEPTFAFLEDVLTEVMALFPSTYIHVGGDEAVKDQWKASPAVQARMRALGIADETALQGWFVERIERFLGAHGRRLIGWDEILEGGIAPDATVTSWRGIEGAIEAAAHGHDAVLSPAPTLYLDNRQGWGRDEPPGRGSLITLRTVYDFDPVPDAIPEEQRHHILGLQANLWTEHVRTGERAAWMTFPRAAAIAEIGWSRPETRDFDGFVDRLIPQLDRMRALGLRPASSAFAVTPSVAFAPPADRASIALANQVGLPIRYTLDGSAPHASSPLYASPLAVPVGTRLRAASFHDGRPLPGALDRLYDARSLRRVTDEELKSCTDGYVLALEDDAPAEGPRATFVTNLFNPCWTYEGAPLAGARAIALDVGQLPFNFQVGDARKDIHFDLPRSEHGEFLVRAGGCDGELVATLPLAPAAGNPAVTRLVAPIEPQAENRDLCITYTARGVEPMWAVDAVELIAP